MRKIKKHAVGSIRGKTLTNQSKITNRNTVVNIVRGSVKRMVRGPPPLPSPPLPPPEYAPQYASPLSAQPSFEVLEVPRGIPVSRSMPNVTVDLPMPEPVSSVLEGPVIESPVIETPVLESPYPDVET